MQRKHPQHVQYSIPLAGFTGVQARYQVGTGYDEATGLGSLDARQFINNFGPPLAISSFSVSPAYMASGGTGVLNITLNAPAPSGGLTIDLATSQLSLTPLPNPYTIPAGQTTASPTFVAGTDTTPTIVDLAASYGCAAVASEPLTVVPSKITPVIVWSTPAPITYGTALSATQLDATANTGNGSGLVSVAGAFNYSPALATILTAGSQTLNVTFTPTDTSNYTTATGSVTLTVNKATPAITWATPAACHRWNRAQRHAIECHRKHPRHLCI